MSAQRSCPHGHVLPRKTEHSQSGQAETTLCQVCGAELIDTKASPNVSALAGATVIKQIKPILPSDLAAAGDADPSVTAVVTIPPHPLSMPERAGTVELRVPPEAHTRPVDAESANFAATADFQPTEVLPPSPGLQPTMDVSVSVVNPALFSPTRIISPSSADAGGSASPQDDRSQNRARIPKGQVAGYEILSELGRGGMGVVYKARHLNLKRLVALKMVIAGAHASALQLARFRAEAEAVAHLQHPNIVQVYEIGEHDGLPFFSLEYVDGGSLSERIGNKPLPPRACAELIRPLAQAMDSAHHRGIIHRDLKPANILLTSDGVPKITDFGLAKRFEEENSLTRTGSVLGTPYYMAPEQASGRSRDVGPLADIYALGSILYELLTARPPFVGATIMETLQQVREKEPVPPTQLQPAVPRDLETICLTCLQKEPRKRYASAGLLAEDLRRFLAGEPIQARPTPTWERLLKWVRRRPTFAALIGVSLLFVITSMAAGLFYARHEYQRAELETELHREAERERRNAEEHARVAEAQRQKAEQEHQRAEENFQQALSAVDEMLTRVGQERLAHEPRMEQVRRDLLQKALAFYLRFLKVRATDPAVRRETARAYDRVGDIQEYLGKYSAASDAYRQAETLFQELAKASPDRPDDWQALGATQTKHSAVLQAMGRRKDAEAINHQAIELKSHLAERFPSVPAFRSSLASSWHNQGLQQQTENRLTDAEASYRRAAEIFSELARDFPKEPAYAQELARTKANWGALLQSRGQKRQAQEMYDQAVTLLSDLVNRSPENPDYRKELGRTRLNQGALFQMNGQPGLAERALREAVAAFRHLADQFPTVPDFRHEQALSLQNLAGLLSARKRIPEAEAALREAHGVLEHLVQEFPATPTYRLDLTRSDDQLGILLASGSYFQQAEEFWRQALDGKQRLAAEFPNEPAYRQELARTQGNLGILLARRNRLTDAEQSFREAIALFDALRTAAPHHLSYLQEELVFTTNLANLLIALDRYHDAEQVLHRIVELYEEQAAALPRDAGVQAGMARAEVSLSKLYFDHTKPHDGQQALRAAIRRWQQALALEPRSAYRRELSACYLQLLEQLAQADRQTEVAELVTELKTVLAKDGADLARAAAILSRSIPAIQQNKKRTDKEIEASVARYGEQAVSLLQAAIASGYRDLDQLQTSPDFAPVRGRTDYQKLLAVLEVPTRDAR